MKMVVSGRNVKIENKSVRASCHSVNNTNDVEYTWSQISSTAVNSHKLIEIFKPSGVNNSLTLSSDVRSKVISGLLNRTSSEEFNNWWSNMFHMCDQTIIAFKSGEEASSDVLHAISTAACLCLDLPSISADNIPSGLYQSCQKLTSLLPSLSFEEKISCTIALIGHKWVAKSFSNADEMSAKVFMYYLNMSLKTGAKKENVRRLWTVHQGLLLSFNFEDEDNSQTTNLMELLLKCYVSEIFYNSNRMWEGHRFLVFLFSLSVKFIPRIHNAIKRTLTDASALVGQLFGYIYRAAWEGFSDNLALRKAVEEICIEDLMYCCVKAPRKPICNIYEPLFALLNVFHSVEQSPQNVRSMAARLWNPILWRNLKCPNDVIRCNATEIFYAAFPLNNPNLSLDERALKKEEHYRMLSVTLLSDSSSMVKASACVGVGQLLSQQWFTFPSDVTESVMTKLTDICKSEINVNVRKSALGAINMIIQTENVASINFVKPLLISLRTILFNKAESVQVGLINLLLTISNSKHIVPISFYDIVPLNIILLRLGKCSNSVGTLIMKLLFPSCFADVSDLAKLERALVLIEEDITATRRFYQYLGKNCGSFVKFDAIYRFLLSILSLMKYFVQKSVVQSEPKPKKQRNTSSKLSKQKEQTSFSLMESIPLDMLEKLEKANVFEGLLEVFCVLYVEIEKRLNLSVHSKHRAVLEKKTSEIFFLLFRYCKASPFFDFNLICVRTIIFISSFMRPSSFSPIISKTLSIFEKELKESELIEITLENWISEEAILIWNDEQPHLLFPEDPIAFSLTQSLCNWKRSTIVLQHIQHWLVEGFRNDCDETLECSNDSSIHDDGRTMVRFCLPLRKSRDSKPILALNLLYYMHHNEIIRLRLLEESLQDLKNIFPILLKITKCRMKVALGGTPTSLTEMRLTHCAFEILLTWIISLESAESTLMDIVESIGRNLALTAIAGEYPIECHVLALRTLASIQLALSNVITLGSNNVAFIRNSLQFHIDIITVTKASYFLPIFLCCLQLSQVMSTMTADIWCETDQAEIDRSEFDDQMIELNRQFASNFFATTFIEDEGRLLMEPIPSSNQMKGTLVLLYRWMVEIVDCSKNNGKNVANFHKIWIDILIESWQPISVDLKWYNSPRDLTLVPNVFLFAMCLVKKKEVNVDFWKEISRRINDTNLTDARPVTILSSIIFTLHNEIKLPHKELRSKVQSMGYKLIEKLDSMLADFQLMQQDSSLLQKLTLFSKCKEKILNVLGPSS